MHIIYLIQYYFEGTPPSSTPIYHAFIDDGKIMKVLLDLALILYLCKEINLSIDALS